MVFAENEFQPCNDPVAWPFAQVAQSAALTKPDLVIHIGNMHYRESPCPAGNAGFAGSPWGYGFATLERQTGGPGQWLMTAFNVQGTPMFTCAITGSKSKCAKAVAAK